MRLIVFADLWIDDQKSAIPGFHVDARGDPCANAGTDRGCDIYVYIRKSVVKL